jgi:hypothetical protein
MARSQERDSLTEKPYELVFPVTGNKVLLTEKAFRELCVTSPSMGALVTPRQSR